VSIYEVDSRVSTAHPARGQPGHDRCYFFMISRSMGKVQLVERRLGRNLEEHSLAVRRRTHLASRGTLESENTGHGSIRSGIVCDLGVLGVFPNATYEMLMIGKAF